MSILVNILLCCLLGLIFYQDLKYRAIHVGLLVMVFFLSFVLAYFETGSLLSALYPILFVGLVLILLWTYFSIKSQRIDNQLLSRIGLGDVFFFFAISPLFHLHNYVIFFITGMFIAMLYPLIRSQSYREHFIPLAGVLAFYLLVWKGASYVFEVNLFFEPLFWMPWTILT